MMGAGRAVRAVQWGWALAIAGCGGGAPPAEEPPQTPQATPRPAVKVASEATPEEPATSTVATTRELPTSCADAKSCFPPSAFVDAVCKKKFPDLPLYFFAPKLPWQHRYVKAEHVEPVNIHGGEQSEEWMKFGEEVVLLRKHSAEGGGGMQISGPTDVDVLRWDGTCATIREEMLVSYVPAPMTSPRIIWKYLAADLQEALLKNAVVARANEGEKKGCRDSSVKHPTPACEKAMRKLTDAIALAVRLNTELPPTGSLPAWVK